MKKNKKDKKSNSIKISTLNYLSSACFFLVAILDFIDKDHTMAVIFFSLGATYLCLASVNVKKEKEEKKNK